MNEWHSGGIASHERAITGTHVCVTGLQLCILYVIAAHRNPRLLFYVLTMIRRNFEASRLTTTDYIHIICDHETHREK